MVGLWSLGKPRLQVVVGFGPEQRNYTCLSPLIQPSQIDIFFVYEIELLSLASK